MFRKLNIRFALLAILIISSTSSNFKPQKNHSEKPNVVFFLIDDLGYSDLGCYGSDYYETPAIDKLAEAGIRFTQNYAASTICSPSRASILTGKYPGRLHITGPIPIYGAERRKNPMLYDADYVMNLPLEEKTIGDAFQEAGYMTAAIGKWHVSHDSLYFPENNGFDYNIGGGAFGGCGNYFSPYLSKWRMTENHPWVNKRIFPEGEEGPEGEYMTDRLTDEAIHLIEKHKDEPFFIYLQHYAVHAPLQAKEDYIKKFRLKTPDDTKGHSNAAYAAMIKSVDESVERVLAKLNQLGLEENTIIVLASDNGGADFATSNWPWRGNKGNFYEGGIRVPLIFKWPGKIKSGAITDIPVITNDYYPTLLELCGIPLKPEQHMDGQSFASEMQQENKPMDSFYSRDLFWHFPNYIGAVKAEPADPCTVIRSGNWKLIQHFEDWSVELYNLKDDPKEKHNISQNHPEKVKELVEKVTAHRIKIEVQMPSVNPAYIKPEN